MASHPKIAHERPKQELLKAQADLIDARGELQASEADLKRKQVIEASALMAWIAAFPSPSAEDVYRAHVARGQAEKIARVAKGLPAVAPKVSNAGGSPIDQQLANRARDKHTGRPVTAARPAMFKA